MEAYCVKCKQKREIVNPEADFNKVGAPITRGTCPVCGMKIFRMGRTEAHAGLTPPEKASRQPARTFAQPLVVNAGPSSAIKRVMPFARARQGWIPG